MLDNLEQELKQFAEYVVKESRANLKRQGKDSTGKLSKSIDSNFKVSKNSFELSFLMEYYGVFQDKGVSGVKKKYNTPYSYTNKMPPPSKMDKWIVRKGLKGVRGKGGKFISRKSLQFMIARSIYNNGIAPSMFFTKPFEKAFKGLSKDLLEPFKLDIENFMKNTINNKATR